MTRRGRPSPALVVGILALIAALAGTAVAGPTATTSVSKKKTKKIARKQAKKYFEAHIGDASVANAASAASAASAANADNANQLGGKDSTAFLPSSGQIRWSVPPSEWVKVAVGGGSVGYFTNLVELRGDQPNLFYNAPVQLPVTLLGQGVRFVRMELCYDVRPNARIDAVQLARINPNAADPTPTGDLLIDDETVRTDKACRSYTPAAPVALGANNILQVGLSNTYSVSSTIAVSRVTIALSVT